MLIRTLIVAATLAALLALFVALRPADEPTAPTTPADTPAGEQARRVQYRLADGAVTGPETVRVPQGRRVELILDSDVAEELHLHGYDLSRRVAAGDRARLLFDADRPGRFALELHGRHERIGALEVQPR